MSDVRDILDIERPVQEINRDSFLANKKQRQFEK